MSGNNKKIGVGIIGANPDRGWAATAHIPALRSLPEYELRAISTSRRETADRAAETFGVTAAFDNTADLLAHPGVDLVVVSVKVPLHFDIVKAAIQADKAVFSEWPLGNGLAEAQEMADRAKAKGVKTIVGLQARLSPAVKHIRNLIAEGYVGEVLSSSVLASGGQWGESVESHGAYLHDESQGATMLTIPFGHTVDALCWTLGEFSELAATTTIRQPNVRVAGTGTVLQKTAADQILVSGILESGAAVSIHYRGGLNKGTNFLWEINGNKGDIVVTGPMGHLQMVDVEVRGRTGKETSLALIPIPDSASLAPTSPSGSSYNVAQMYAQFAADLRDGTSLTPDFDTAVRRHQMIEAIQSAAHSGERRRYEH